MEQIKSLSQLSPLIMSQIKKGVITNAVSTPASFESEIREGTLFVKRVISGLVLLRQRPGFWLMNFYLQPGARLCDLKLPDQTVMEISTRTRDVALKASEQQWEHWGFKLMTTRQRMILLQRRADFIVRSHCLVRQAEEKDQSTIRQMMEENYDCRTACLPTDTELHADIADGDVWVSVSAEGQVCGFLRLCSTEKVVEVRQIATAIKFRNQGIAGALLDKLVLGDGQCGRVWVAKNNAPALRLYKNIGFTNDRWTSTVWLYEKG